MLDLAAPDGAIIITTLVYREFDRTCPKSLDFALL